MRKIRISRTARSPAPGRCPGTTTSSRPAMRRTPCFLPSNDFLRLDHTQAVEIRTKRLGNDDGPILLLIVFHYGDPGSANGKARTIEGVYEANLLPGGGPITDIRASRLKILEVAARRNLAISILAG